MSPLFDNIVPFKCLFYCSVCLCCFMSADQTWTVASNGMWRLFLTQIDSLSCQHNLCQLEVQSTWVTAKGSYSNRNQRTWEPCFCQFMKHMHAHNTSLSCITMNLLFKHLNCGDEWREIFIFYLSTSNTATVNGCQHLYNPCCSFLILHFWPNSFRNVLIKNCNVVFLFFICGFVPECIMLKCFACFFFLFFFLNISLEQCQHHKPVFGTGMLCLIEIDFTGVHPP